MKWLFSRIVDRLPDWDWVIHLLELTPDSWHD
jgi:hypothetical protein